MLTTRYPGRASLAQSLLLACQGANNPDRFSYEFVGAVASAFGSPFCAWLDSDATPVAQVSRGGEPSLARLREWCSVLPYLDNNPDPGCGVQSVAMAPMLFRSQLAGVLVVAGSAGGYTAADLETLADAGKLALAQYEFMRATEEMCLLPADWAARECVGRIVHKLRQPLSTIETSAVYLDMILPADANAHAHLEAMREQVCYASRVLDEAAQPFDKPAPDGERAASRSLTNAATAAVTY